MQQVRLGEAPGRWVLAATVLGSGIAFLDGTVVNVALPAIGRDLDADLAKAIGAWSGLAGVTTVIGPFLGGYLIDTLSWRWIFLINVPLCAAVVIIALRTVPESRDLSAVDRPDSVGAVLGAVGLGGVTFALIAAGDQAALTVVAVSAAVGALGLVAFVAVELRQQHPMLPPGIFRSRQFTVANVMTLAVYAALAGVGLFLTIQLQVGAGWSALEAGAALVPVSGLLLVLSAPAGALATRIGPQIPMTVGPLLCAVGVGMLAVTVDRDPSYLIHVLPGVIVFGLGLSLLVAPLTATVLAAVEDRHAGVASGVSNAVARTASLLAVAVLPLAVGISGDEYADPEAFTGAFDTAMWLCVGLLAVGGVISAADIRRDVLPGPDRASGSA